MECLVLTCGGFAVEDLQKENLEYAGLVYEYIMVIISTLNKTISMVEKFFECWIYQLEISLLVLQVSFDRKNLKIYEKLKNLELKTQILCTFFFKLVHFQNFLYFTSFQKLLVEAYKIKFNIEFSNLLMFCSRELWIWLARHDCQIVGWKFCPWTLCLFERSSQAERSWNLQ